MKLKDIENHISPAILKRGEEYRNNGHIVEIEEVEEGKYHAEVEGSGLYEVQVRIGSRGEIQYADCDCPFDMDVLCKHQVAVLLEIRASLTQSVSKEKAEPKAKLSEQLGALSKEQLVELLVGFAQEIREVKQRLDIHFMKSEGTDDLKQFVKLIRTYVKQNSERNGFVSYRNVSRAVTGAEMVLEKVSEARQKGESLKAALISFCVLHELTDLIQSSDDSDGIIGNLIEECLDYVAKSVESVIPASSNDKRTLFLMLLGEAHYPGLRGWEHWKLAILESAMHLVDNETSRQEWETSVRKLEANEEEPRADSYLAKSIAVLRYRMIQLHDDAQSGVKFLEENMGLSDIRELAIKEAIEQQRYDDALRFAQDGEQQDAVRGYPGLVNTWKKLRLEVYRFTNQIDLQRRLTEEFASSGEYSYYQQLKELYSPENWPSVYSRVLAELEKEDTWSSSSMYTRLLVEENETARLLEYVSRKPYVIAEYYKHLIVRYPDEVYRLFETHIEKSISDASNRKQYKKVCQSIRELIKAGGQQSAKVTVENLRQRYSKRSALLDELDLINWPNQDTK